MACFVALIQYFSEVSASGCLFQADARYRRGKNARGRGSSPAFIHALPSKCVWQPANANFRPDGSFVLVLPDARDSNHSAAVARLRAIVSSGEQFLEFWGQTPDSNEFRVCPPNS